LESVDFQTRSIGVAGSRALGHGLPPRNDEEGRMCECLGGCCYEFSSERLAALEQELREAVDSGERERAARLRERITDLRCGCRRLRDMAA